MSRLTLDDLAKRARVSAKTISRVVNKLPGVGAEKRAEIEQLISETGFKPNIGARILASARSFTLCLLVQGDTSHYYYAELQLGVSRACIEAGYHLVVEPVKAVLEQGRATLERRLISVQPDGCIVVPPLTEDLDVLETLEAIGMPYVRIAPVYNKARSSYVEMDDERASYDITRHLIELGHRDIAWIAVTRNLASMKIREAGYLRALYENGLEANPLFATTPPEPPDYGHEEAFRLLTADKRPSALVCGNDSVALASLAAAYRAGLIVPKDLSIVGFDNSPGSESCWPPLTTINQPISLIGQRAAEILVRHLDRDKPLSGMIGEQVEYSLIHRGSTARPDCDASKP